MAEGDPKSMIRVFLERLVKRRDREAVVDLDPEIPLEVGPGELTFVLGPTGSGQVDAGAIDRGAGDSR